MGMIHTEAMLRRTFGLEIFDVASNREIKVLLHQRLPARRASAAALDEATQSRPMSLFNKSNHTVATLPERTESAVYLLFTGTWREKRTDDWIWW